MKIILATDGSGFSNEAARKCCEFVSADGDTKIRIISVAEPLPRAAEPFIAMNIYHAEAEAGAMKIAEEAVAGAEKIIREKFSDADIQTEVIKGNAKSAIVADAKSFGADLIVLGSHGYGFLERLFLGSVSNAVVNRASCSVLVVRTNDDEDF